MKNFGDATQMDPGLHPEAFEWKRKVERENGMHEALCNPEDVIRTKKCQAHDENTVCPDCMIPICDECWNICRPPKYNRIPKALANDNQFQSYGRKHFCKK